MRILVPGIKVDKTLYAQFLHRDTLPDPIVRIYFEPVFQIKSISTTNGGVNLIQVLKCRLVHQGAPGNQIPLHVGVGQELASDEGRGRRSMQ